MAVTVDINTATMYAFEITKPNPDENAGFVYIKWKVPVLGSMLIFDLPAEEVADFETYEVLVNQRYQDASDALTALGYTVTDVDGLTDPP